MSSCLEWLPENDFKDNVTLISGSYPFGKIVGGEPFCGVVLVHPCDMDIYLVLQTSFMILQGTCKGCEVISGRIGDASEWK